MRLPLSKVWRAFPELDRFDDARCQRYVREAKRESRRSGLLVAALIPLSVFAWMVSVAIAIAIMDMLNSGGVGPGGLGTIVALALYVGTPFVLMLVFLLARDRWLHGAIRSRLNIARCLGCSYSLLGLAPIESESGSHVICPECGKTGELADEMLEQMQELGVIPTP